MKKTIRIIIYVIIALFAVIGFTFSAIYVGMHFDIFSVRGAISTRNDFFSATSQKPNEASTPCNEDTVTVCPWNQTQEWATIKGGIQKDIELIHKVAAEVNVDPRMIAATVIPEQTRFFTSNRDIFKSYFEPLKILGSLTKFSLGISGMKIETAQAIESHIKNPNSLYYLGESTYSLIQYPENVAHGQELYRRLTDDKNRYYQYLYTALYIKQIQTQWAAAGYYIERKPEIIVTLFNLGFSKSRPNPNPKAGGAIITTGGIQYTYGELGSLFYYSNELPEL
jgi:hypothetical protein